MPLADVSPASFDVPLRCPMRIAVPAAATGPFFSTAIEPLSTSANTAVLPSTAPTDDTADFRALLSALFPGMVPAPVVPFAPNDPTLAALKPVENPASLI